jgi:uncharacterized protein (TIGR00369 family)
MSEFQPLNPDYEAQGRASFARQKAMALIGARLMTVTPGLVRIELPFRDDLTQQHGLLHGGITSMIADTAAGFAAFTLMPPGSAVLTVEYKINLVSPGRGELFVAMGRVKKPGRTLVVCELDVEAIERGKSKVIAYGLETLMCLEPRADLPAG